MKTLRFSSPKPLWLIFWVVSLLEIPPFSPESPFSFLAHAAESPLVLDPGFEKIKSRVSYVPGIKVIRGVTQLIVPEQEFYCPAVSVFKYNNGDIHVYDRRSTDGGKTWFQTENVLEASTYQYPEPDGEVLMFRSLATGGGSSTAGRPESSLRKTDRRGVFEATFFRSKDNGLTREEDPATIYLPEDFDGWRCVLCRKIVRLADGSLLMSMYCRKEDGNDFEKKYRSLVIRSTDRGKTWRYLSTIAFDMREGVRGEGFDETTLLVLPSGKILGFIRSGASYQASIGSSNHGDPSVEMPFGYAKQTPVYMSISIDGGETWSNADPVSPYGVWPGALVMDNGLIVVTYGRPGNWMMFSKDEGNHWGPIIPFYHGLYPPDCSNYFSVAEVAPNTLLAVYARTNPNNHWRSEIAGTYFHVIREEE